MSFFDELFLKVQKAAYWHRRRYVNHDEVPVLTLWENDPDAQTKWHNLCKTWGKPRKDTYRAGLLIKLCRKNMDITFPLDLI